MKGHDLELRLDTLGGIVSLELGRRVAALLRRACDGDLKLAAAESCTAGLVAALLTDVEGCSHAFDRGFVAYAEEAKEQLLGVPRALIEAHDAVSREVAVAMAEGGLARSSADACLAVTGYADDADGEVPAGLVHFAVAVRGAPTDHKKCEYGDLGRGAVRLACLDTAVELLEAAVDRASELRSSS